MAKYMSRISSVYIYNIYEHNIHVYSYLYRALQNPHDHHPVGFNDLAGPFIFKSWCHSRLAGKISEKKCLFCVLSKTAKKEMLLHLYIYLFIITFQTLRVFGRNQCLSEALLARHEKDNQNPEHMTSTSRGPIVCKIHREIGGTLGMVALIINPIYTWYSGISLWKMTCIFFVTYLKASSSQVAC